MESLDNLLRKKNSLSMAVEAWERLRRSPGWFRDSIIAVDHFSDAERGIEAAEYIVTEAAMDGQPSSEYQLNLLLEHFNASDVECDFGAGQFLRPPRVGQILLSDNEEVHKQHGRGTFHSICMTFDKSLLQNRLLALANGKSISLEPLFSKSFLDDEVQRIIIRLLGEFRDVGHTQRTLGADILLDGLCHRLLRLVKHREDVHRDSDRMKKESVSKILDYMRANLDRNLEVDELAREAGVSRGHFLRLFRQSTGHSPKKYLMDLRIEAAKEQLRFQSDEVSIETIARHCGFPSRAHFYREFASHVGLSPDAFRQLTK